MREEYAGREQTKSMMRKDGMMIQEDWSAPCLLPMNVISKDWPAAPESNMGMIGGDLFMGVQKQLKEDHADFAKVRSPKKY